MSSNPYSLVQLGWRPFFEQQITQESTALVAARVTAVHRNAVEALTVSGPTSVTLPGLLLQQGLSATVAVGDWILVERDTGRAHRVLERQSTLARLAAGERHERQLIAANVDALFVVTSCNDDFNPSRLERYFALAGNAGIEPVLVLTKADLSTQVDQYVDAVRAIAPRIIVLTVNATLPESGKALAPWLGAGQTVAFMGSSGVGKSTLVNTLTAAAMQDTAGIREGDSKGRHTTTSRQMFALPGGAWVIDTPGIRELKLDVGDQAVGAVFADIEAIAKRCRFRDCTHHGDEGCAVSLAIGRGELDARRLASYDKLLREVARTTRTAHERREREREFGRTAKAVMRHKRMERGRK